MPPPSRPDEPVLATLVPPKKDCPSFILLSAANLVTLAVLMGPGAAWMAGGLRRAGAFGELTAPSRWAFELAEASGPAWWIASLALLAAGWAAEKRIASRAFRLWAMGLTTAAVVLCFPLIEGMMRWLMAGR
jgi:hypothetical protein